MKNMTKKTVALLCCSALAAGLFTGCGSEAVEEDTTGSTAVVVDVQTATRGSIRLQGTYVGNVSAGESVYVIPLANAAVEEVNVAVGSEVKEGQVLAKLDSKVADLTMAQAQAAYDSVVAQAQSALGGTWNTNMYQAERGLEQMQDGIDTYNDQIDSANKSKDALNAAVDEMNKRYESLTTVELTVTADNLSLVNGAEARALTKGNYTWKTPAGGRPDNELFQIGDCVKVNLNDKSGMPDAANMNVLTGIAVSEGEKGLSDDDVKKVTTDYVENGIQTARIQSQKSELVSAQAQAESGVKQLEAARDNMVTQKETTEGTLNITKTQVYQETVNSLQKGLAQAQVGLDSAAYQKSLYTLTAPISGIVESVGLTKDSFATSSSVAFTISNKDSMVLTFYVAEDVRDELSYGQPVTVSRGKNTYSGAITEIGNAVDMQKGLFKVKATVYNAPDIATGVTATLTTTCHSAENVLTVPCSAVYYDNGEAYLFVYHDGVAVKTIVETGIYDDNNIAILSGLIDGQQVITTWSPNLVDGAEVVLPGQS